jgi:predicted metal-dependent phosphoesterase TrpH
MPPAARQLPPAPATTVYGAYHIHTDRSDGSGSLDDVARAAAEAGLGFIVLTDHGTATQAPEPPQYRHGVLVIDAVEISTISGHLVAVGLQAASPFPIGAEARDTIEDVHRMGGWTIAAHPDSPKPGLRWRGQETAVDGIEWLNADSEWRDESPAELLTNVGHYLLRPSEAIAAVFQRPDASLRRWDQLSRRRPVVALAAVDAHARIGMDETEEPRRARTILARPSYLDMFRTVVQAVELPAPPAGNAAVDAGIILDALRGGRTYSVVRALATPGQVSFTASDGRVTRGMGESLSTAGPVTIRASVPAPSDAVVVLLRNGVEVNSATGEVTMAHSGPEAVYRTEVRLPGHAVPWIVTNALRVGVPPDPPLAPLVDPLPPQARTHVIDDPASWIIEKHPASSATVATVGGEVALAFQLAPGANSGQYVAMAHALGGPDSFDRVSFTIRASAPMRVSIQVRLPLGPDGERWHRSVYAGTAPRTVTLRLQDFEPSDGPTSRRPIVTRLRSLLLVIDTWHTRPGTAGTVWLSGIALGAPADQASAMSGR